MENIQRKRKAEYMGKRKRKILEKMGIRGKKEGGKIEKGEF